MTLQVPTVRGTVGPTLPFDMAFATGLDKTFQTGIVMFLLMTSVTKSDTVFVTTIATTSVTLVLTWLDTKSATNTAKEL